MSTDIVDKPINTTLRTITVTLSGLIVGAVASFSLMTSTFVTDGQYKQDSSTAQKERMKNAQNIADTALRLSTHESSTEVYRLNLSLESVGDQLWLVDQRIKEPGGDTRDNRERRQDLYKRKTRIHDQITCLKSGSKFCMPTISDF